MARFFVDVYVYLWAFCPGTKGDTVCEHEPKLCKGQCRRCYERAYYAAGRKRRGDRSAESKRYRARYPERARAAVAAYTKAHPEIHCAKEHRRRARKRGASGSYSGEEWLALLDFYGHRCCICATDGKLTVDHVVALANGGSNNLDNLQPLCAPCNSRKGARE